MDRRARNLAFASFVLLAAIPPAHAQDEEVFDLFRPTLTLEVDSSGERSFREDEDPNFPIDANADAFRWRSGRLNLVAPLGGTHLGRPGAILGYQYLAIASAGASSVDLSTSFLDEDLRLYGAGVGVGALVLSRGRKLYAGAIFIGGAEEEESRDDPDLRYSGIGLGSFHRGSTLWIYGGAYTYHLGRGLLLPLFGAWSKISPSWSLAGAVPFLFRATYQPAPRWSLGLFMKVSGNRYGFDNSDDPGTAANEARLPAEASELFVRIVQGRIGADLSWRLSDRFSLVAEAGSLVARRLVISDGDDEVLASEIEPGGYASVRLRIGFGDTLFDEAKP